MSYAYARLVVKARRAEKQASREADIARRQAGDISAEQLQQENGFFNKPHTPRAPPATSRGIPVRRSLTLTPHGVLQAPPLRLSAPSRHSRRGVALPARRDDASRRGEAGPPSPLSTTGA